jgi:Bacterial transcriptional activator domain
MLAFRILGPLEVVDDEGPLRLGGPKQRATLAILLLNANRVVSIDRLADDLYAGAPPATAVTQVQRQISELRKALTSPSPIETRAPGYVIRLEPDGLDLARFERLAEDAGRALRRGEARQAAELLREALGLWRGEPLADLREQAQSAIRSSGLPEWNSAPTPGRRVGYERDRFARAAAPARGATSRESGRRRHTLAQGQSLILGDNAAEPPTGPRPYRSRA